MAQKRVVYHQVVIPIGRMLNNPQLRRETGLHYNYFRDYDPSTGRYIESDPIGLAGGLNTYAYVYGNPLRHTDFYGLDPGDIFPTKGAAAADMGQYSFKWGGQPAGSPYKVKSDCGEEGWPYLKTTQGNQTVRVPLKGNPDYPDASENVAYTYDSCTLGKGQLCAVTDASGSSVFGYDAYGNRVTEDHTELGELYHTVSTYDARDRIATITHPDGRLVSYTRDALGRIASVSATVNGASQTISSNRLYRADGVLRQQTFGNALVETRTHDLRGWMSSQVLGTVDSRVYDGYDPNGNLTSLVGTDDSGDFGYDALDRLTSEDWSVIADRSYSYDANANRLSKHTSGGALES